MRSRVPMRRVYRVALCGILTGVMLVLGFLESQLPAGPIPGIKLGLSNSLLVCAIYFLGIPTAFLLMLLKVALSGLLFGGVSAMMYALAGGVLSMLVMAGLSRLRGVHMIVVSMAGGMMHNVGQVALAMLILRTPKLIFYMAVLMLVGMACGAVSGICATRVKHILETVKPKSQ